MNRLGVFLFYDESGIVDKYIEFLLDDITPLFERFVIVCNGKLSPDGRDILENYTKEIYVRENVGFDFSAWRDTLINYIGFNRVKEYDQLVLFNDSFFGPFYSFSKIFSGMDSRNLDFWGLSVHGEVDTVKKMCPYGYRPRYIQTYFLVMNKRMLNDDSFFNYWNRLPVYSKFLEVSEKISAVFTKYFEDLGFKWGVYTDTSDLETNRDTNICHHAFNTYEMIANRHYPIIKRKSFVLGKSRFLKYNHSLDLKYAVDYIKEYTDYDMDLIYDHLIRRYNLPELKETMNLDIILDDDVNDAAIDKVSEILLICFLNKKNEFDKWVQKLLKLDSRLKIVFYVDGEESKNKLKDIIQNDDLPAYEINVLEKNMNGFLLLLETLQLYKKSYKYFCVLHDFNCSDNLPITLGNSLRDLAWDNIVNCNAYINGIVKQFENNKYIGMIVPPKAWFGPFFQDGIVRQDDMTSCFECWNKILGTDMKVPKDNFIIGGEGAFWIRQEAVDTMLFSEFEKSNALLDIEHLDDMMIRGFEIMLPHLVKENGFYTYTCSNRNYAIAELESQRYVNRELVGGFGKLLNIYQSSYINFFREMEKKVKDYMKIANGKKEKIKYKIKYKEKIVKTEVPVEVPVLVEIGLARALKNYLFKMFRKQR